MIASVTVGLGCRQYSWLGEGLLGEGVGPQQSALLNTPLEPGIFGNVHFCFRGDLRSRQQPQEGLLTAEWSFWLVRGQKEGAGRPSRLSRRGHSEPLLQDGWVPLRAAEGSTFPWVLPEVLNPWVIVSAGHGARVVPWDIPRSFWGPICHTLRSSSAVPSGLHIFPPVSSCTEGGCCSFLGTPVLPSGVLEDRVAVSKVILSFTVHYINHTGRVPQCWTGGYFSCNK